MAVWQPALFKFLTPQDWTPALIESLLYPNQPLVNLSAVLILSAIMTMIWKHRWKSIVDEKAFDTNIILCAIDCEVNYLLAQVLEKKRLQDRKHPPPLPNITPPQNPLVWFFFYALYLHFLPGFDIFSYCILKIWLSPLDDCLLR